MGVSNFVTSLVRFAIWIGFSTHVLDREKRYYWVFGFTTVTRRFTRVGWSAQGENKRVNIVLERSEFLQCLREFSALR